MPLLPLALYVHIPWCIRKCPYCDFNSHALTGTLPTAQLLAALEADLIEELPLMTGRPLVSLFIGGGTPSLLSADTIDRLLSMVRRHCDLAAKAEITLEVNPGTLERGQFRDYAMAGITRVSIGVQSFADPALRMLGRVHSALEAMRAIEEALKAGFQSCNLDLMHGLPGQDAAAAASDLKIALAFGSAHISWYQLTIEPNTAFYSNPPVLPDEQTLASIERLGLDLLARAGLARYEVSAYSTPGHESRHNLNYWQFGDYVGIGPGAHGKLTTAVGQIIRRWKFRRPNQYLQGQPGYLAGQRVVSGTKLSQEYLMNALRLLDGTDEALYQARTLLPLSSLQQWRTRNIEDGLLVPGQKLQATFRGLRFLDDLLADFQV